MLVTPGAGFVAVAAVIAMDNALVYYAAAIFLPMLTVVAAHAVAVGGAAVGEVDRRGYLAASIAAFGLSLFSLSSPSLPGPAHIIAAAFVYLGWIRRDALVAAVAAAALLVALASDVKGPLVIEAAPARLTSLLVAAAFLIVAGLTRPSLDRRRAVTT
jgi:hypothetical protein